MKIISVFVIVTHVSEGICTSESDISLLYQLKDSNSWQETLDNILLQLRPKL